MLPKQQVMLMTLQHLIIITPRHITRDTILKIEFNVPVTEPVQA